MRNKIRLGLGAVGRHNVDGTVQIRHRKCAAVLCHARSAVLELACHLSVGIHKAHFAILLDADIAVVHVAIDGGQTEVVDLVIFAGHDQLAARQVIQAVEVVLFHGHIAVVHHADGIEALRHQHVAFGIHQTHAVASAHFDITGVGILVGAVNILGDHPPVAEAYGIAVHLVIGVVE